MYLLIRAHILVVMGPLYIVHMSRTSGIQHLLTCRLQLYVRIVCCLISLKFQYEESKNEKPARKRIMREFNGIIYFTIYVYNYNKTGCQLCYFFFFFFFRKTKKKLTWTRSLSLEVSVQIRLKQSQSRKSHSTTFESYNSRRKKSCSIEYCRRQINRYIH